MGEGRGGGERSTAVQLMSSDQRDLVLAAHPDLTRRDVQACLAYAKAMVTGEEVSPNRQRERPLMSRLCEIPVRPEC